MTAVDVEDVLVALEQYHRDTGHPVAGAPDLEDSLPIGRRRILDKLELLEARGDVASCSIGRGRGWYAVDVVSVSFPPAEPPAEPLEEPPAEPLEEPPAEPPAEPSTAPPAETADLLEAFTEWLADEPPRTSHGKAASVAVWELLLEGAQETGDLKAAAYDRAREEYASEKSAWDSIKRYVSDFPGVRNPTLGKWEIDLESARNELLRE